MSTPDKVKQILLGSGMNPLTCSHQGYLIPQEMAPVPCILPGGEDGKQKVQVMIWKTLSSRCVKCGHIIGHFPGPLPGVPVPDTTGGPTNAPTC
jgi:hypothetical protein